MASTEAAPAAPASSVIKIGTRRSPLALKQTEHLIAELQKAHPGLTFEVVAIKTQGDKDKVSPLPSMGKGLWTNELEAMLAAGEVDMVLHCLKDMPTTVPAGFELGVIMEREDPRDVVVIRSDAARAGCRCLADLPAGSLVGTSSPRRSAQLRRRHPALRFRDYRGNIDTRLSKLDAEGGEFDCIILAAAGLHRMGLHARVSQYLDSAAGVLHAVGQGALGIEVRAGDARVLAVARAVAHEATSVACHAERAVMRALEGGCSVPVGVETSWGEDGRRLRLKATVVSLDGTEAVDADDSALVSTAEEAEAFGKKVALDLVARGASKILDVINETRLAPPVKTTTASS
ncbi:hypothetical protein RB595_008145 [Gaeumannomyces hyphopodioides]